MGAIGRYRFSCVNIFGFGLFLFLISLALVGCENKRPPGFLSLGKVDEIAVRSGFLKDKQIYLHRDAGGIAGMSTLCSFDLSPLRPIVENGKEILISDYNPSRYDTWGNVLSGPAKHGLPFYRLNLDSGVYGGPKDTLYAAIGTEVSRDWRLPISVPVVTVAPVVAP